MPGASAASGAHFRHAESVFTILKPGPMIQVIANIGVTMSIWTELAGVDFAQRYVDVKGVRTRVLMAGAGEPLIFLHGTGGYAEAFARNIGPHAEHFQVHALDMV